MGRIKTQEELLEKLNMLEIEDEQQKKEVTCALIGHSRIQTFCFGYFYCARCGEQLGDSLGGYYANAEKVVIVGHKCPICEKNYKELTWKDKIFCPNPFTDEEE